MDASVDVFASKVAADPYLQNGFHAIGLSQGNNVIRGYIARYNTPSVHTFISINGVNAGEGTVPGCFPSLQDNDKKHHDIDNTDERLGGICSLLLEQASRRAYSDFAQEHSFQANYWRDPREEKAEMYHQYSQLARWNNEGPNNNNSTYNENWAKTQKFVWVMATQDGMVWPSQGEWWGQPDSKDPFNTPVIPMNETDWYVNDLFGLKTAQEAGKNFFESFDGDHLQFSIEDFDRWVKTYISARREQYNIHASVQ
jgi:palmitoyl-protein thioesterase